MSIKLLDTIYKLTDDADKIDGYHFTDLCSNRPHHFVSANDTSCWYKLITIDVIATGWGDLFYEFEITGRISGNWGRIRIWTITHNSDKLFGLDPKVTYDGTLGGKFKAYRYTENNIDRFELWMSLGAWETWNFYVRTYEREAGYMTLTWNKEKFTTAPTGFTKEITIGKQDIAGSASKLATPRTISLTGSVTGSGSFDGSSDLTITTTTNHTHNYASTVKVGDTSYSSSSNVISLPAYPTLSSLGAAASSHTHTKAQITDFSHTHPYYPLSGNINMSGDNVWIGSTMGGGTDYWRIGGYGTEDSSICKITIGDNSNDKFQIQVADYSGTTYTPLEVTYNRLNVSGLANITANGKTLTIGSQDADHCHYSTDAPCHWFNKLVRVAGDIYGGSSYNRRLAYVDEVSLSGHTHNYAGSSSAGGTANAAKKLELVSSGITTTTNDTTAKWGPLGTSVHFVSVTGQLINQPSQYGMILNMTTGAPEVAQLWFTQNTGTLYHRQGNAAGWGCNWTAILDTTNYSTWAATKNHTHDYAASSHTHNYLPLSGGTMTGTITVKVGSDGVGLKFGTSTLNSLSNQLLWQSPEAIRFGSASWDWNAWAGLKYNHSSKIIYLGLADGTIFNANSGQSGGKLYTPGISDIYIGNGSHKVLHSNNWSSYCASASHNHTTIVGNYTANGGKQNPNYFGVNRVGALMMNTTVNGNSHYKDWLFMDCYAGSDVGGGVAIGVNRQALGAYIMRSAAARTSWAESAELIGTHNYTTYCAKASHSHSYLPLSGGTLTGTLHVKDPGVGNYTEGIRLYGTEKDSTWSHICFGCDPAATNGTHTNQWLLGRSNANNLVIRSNSTDLITITGSGTFTLSGTMNVTTLQIGGQTITFTT